jgi:hypothetical protein
MATTKAEFLELADDLIDDEFAEFFTSRDFTLKSGYDPMTGGYSSTITLPVLAARIEYDTMQVDGSLIQVGDFQLLAKVSEFTTLQPRTDGLQVDVDGVLCQVIRATKDPADAAWIMQVRAV